MAWPTEAGSLGLIAAAPEERESRHVHTSLISSLFRPPPVSPPYVLLSRQTFVRRRIDRLTRRPQSRIRPEAALRGKHYLDARGLYRVFNAAEYRFYRDNSAPPEEGDSPFATNATLPHEPADVYADGTWYLSVSYYNGVMDSGFLPLGPAGETYLRLDLVGGDEADAPPAAPLDWRIEAAADGAVRVIGLYFEVGDLRADQWSIGYVVDGVTPPTVVTVALSPGPGLAILDYLLPEQYHGASVTVLLQTRRGTASPIYSENSTVKTVAADAHGPTVPVGAERGVKRLSQ